MSRDETAAGIDGCKGGWLIATVRGVEVVPALRGVLGGAPRFACVGVDMPIGLSDGSPRSCDVEARRFLGPARSSVFPAPPRAALACTTYETALAASRAASGRGMSVQTYNIMRKVAELDALVHDGNREAVVEVHPECSFLLLNDGFALPSKRSADGRALRRRLLAEHFDVPANAPRGAAIDDVLDAYAVLWSIERYRRGEHRSFGDGRRDDRGLEMRIVC